MTVTVPQDKRKDQSNEGAPCNKRQHRLVLNVIRKNEGVLSPESVPVGGRLCQFVEGW